jgi:hypothetical protein
MAIRPGNSTLTTLVKNRLEELIRTEQQVQDAIEAYRIQWCAWFIESWPDAISIDVGALCDDRVCRPVIGITQEIVENALSLGRTDPGHSFSSSIAQMDFDSMLSISGCVITPRNFHSEA